MSLFAGVGGFDLALQRAGVTVTAAVEIDPKARAVLARQFPDTTLFPDVTEVTGNDLRSTGFVPERGIITGGFPCQDLSVAGRRAGLAGARSGLFWEIVRLLDELTPRWCVLENVPGLLSSGTGPGGDMGVVLGTLGELGYGFAYRVLDAQFFGVPQRRRRIFIVGHFGDGGGRSAAQVLLEPESVRGDSASRDEERSRVATALTGGLGSGGPDAAHAAAGWLIPVSTERERERVFRLQAFGQYEADMVTSTLKSRDHKDATDLVVAP